MITAEEFLEQENYPESLSGGTLHYVMIEFAKLHVEAALKAKIEAMEEHMNGGFLNRISMQKYYSLDEINSFTYNVYPLENIK